MQFNTHDSHACSFDVTTSSGSFDISAVKRITAGGFGVSLLTLHVGRVLWFTDYPFRRIAYNATFHSVKADPQHANNVLRHRHVIRGLMSWTSIVDELLAKELRFLDKTTDMAESVFKVGTAALTGGPRLDFWNTFLLRNVVADRFYWSCEGARYTESCSCVTPRPNPNASPIPVVKAPAPAGDSGALKRKRDPVTIENKFGETTDGFSRDWTDNWILVAKATSTQPRAPAILGVTEQMQIINPEPVRDVATRAARLAETFLVSKEHALLHRISSNISLAALGLLALGVLVSES